jgi:hypothetical protein
VKSAEFFIKTRKFATEYFFFGFQFRLLEIFWPLGFNVPFEFIYFLELELEVLHKSKEPAQHWFEPQAPTSSSMIKLLMNLHSTRDELNPQALVH